MTSKKVMRTSSNKTTLASSATSPVASRVASSSVRAADMIGSPTAISSDLLRPLPGIWNALLLSLVALVIGFLLWAAFATVEETTKGTGRVIPASKIQLVQNLEGGIIRALQVNEGQSVRAGDVLLRIDPTQAGASLGEAKERIAGLSALVTRLAAEATGSPPNFEDQLRRDHRRYVEEQQTLYETRRLEFTAAQRALQSLVMQRKQELRELDAKVGTLTRALTLAKSERDIIAPIAASGAASKAELLAVETKVNETEGALAAATLAIPRVNAQRDEATNRLEEHSAKFRADVLRELAKARVELRALTEANRGTADKVDRTIVRAPVSGIVKTVHVTTIGQVVKPGSDLVEIVPRDDTLLVEARVRPRDIAFLRPGQAALVKLTAYDFSLFGGLDGELTRISADSITDDKGETFYLIQVRTKESHIGDAHEDLQILPGMVAEVDIMTGSRTVLTYLTKPLTRMRERALTER